MKSNTWCVLILALVALPAALSAQSILIRPGTPSVMVTATVQFTASVSGLSSNNVTWAAGGQIGGTAAAGMISAGGLYTAPATIPGQNPVMIVATSTVNPAISATTYVYLLVAAPSLVSASPNPLTIGTISVTLTGGPFQPGATIIESFGNYSGIQMTTTAITANTVTATGYVYGASSVTFMVRNNSSVYSTPLTVPVIGAAPTYALNVVGGTGTGAYTAGTVVNIQANAPPAGQVFTNWTGGAVASPTSPNTTFTMGTAGVTLTAHFAVPVPMYPLTVTGGTGSGSYAAGANVTIIANAAPGGQMFLNWTGAAVTNAALATTTLAMPAAPTSVTANYQPIPVPNPTSISLASVPIGVFTFNVNGTNFMANSQVTLGGVPLGTKFVSVNVLTVTGFTNQGGTPNLVVTNLGVPSAPLQVQVGPPNAVVTINAAKHFLQQAAFGPTSAEATNVQTLGFQGWLSAQFAMPKVSNYHGLGSQGGMPTRFLTNAVNQPDQLRQRVSLALSELFTISINKVIWNGDQEVYQEMLMTDAFSNFRQILQDVTLSPGMGDFLDMANNSKANAAGTVLPNENYAREVMQLFAIGTVMLNQDGTKQLDPVTLLPIPTYYQSDVSTFAKIYTGWTYPNPYGYAPSFPSYINSMNGPMVPVPQYHDTSAKTLLQYTPLPGTNPPMTSPAGLSAQQDLANALDNLFYHPNVGPFIGKQMIQHLVKSNPSPAYVARVAAAFNDNGQGVRGDMQAVITAVLTDQEARANDVAGMTQPTDGHMQEPILFLAGFLRAFGAYVDDTNYYSSDLAAMGEDIYDAPSVFSYFSPGYQVPGYPGLTGPEMQIYNPYTSVYRDNLVSAANGQGLFVSWGSPIQSNGTGTVVDLTPFVALAGNPSTLVDALDLTLTCGLAPAGLKNILINAVSSEQGGALRQVQTAIFLLLSSGYYNVWN
jgi:hypothetical protein